MANKKEAKKARRKENRVTRNAEKMQRRKTKDVYDGIGQLAEKRDEPEDFSQAAARIVKDATEER
jgi:hypothetical protein